MKRKVSISLYDFDENKDYSRYKKLTLEEINSMSPILARLFVGNNLFCYLIQTPRAKCFIKADDYEKMLSEFGVSINDKSGIKRVGFSVPKGQDATSILNCDKVRLEPTEGSKQDACMLFGQRQNGVFLYAQEYSIMTRNTLKKLYLEFCYHKNKTKIEQEVDKARRIEAQKTLEKLKSSDWISVFDTELNQVVGYMSVVGQELTHAKRGRVSMQQTRGFVHQVTVRRSDNFISKSDADKLGLNLNVVYECSSQSVCATRGREVTLLRVYESMEVQGTIYELVIEQGLNGVVSYFKDFDNEEFGLSSNVLTFPSGVKYEVFALQLENLRLSGNVWFKNSGRPFVAPKRATKPSNTDKSGSNIKSNKKAKSGLGLLTDAFKNN